MCYARTLSVFHTATLSAAQPSRGREPNNQPDRCHANRGLSKTPASSESAGVSAALSWIERASGLGPKQPRHRCGPNRRDPTTDPRRPGRPPSTAGGHGRRRSLRPQRPPRVGYRYATAAVVPPPAHSASARRCTSRAARGHRRPRALSLLCGGGRPLRPKRSSRLGRQRDQNARIASVDLVS
jgi:hypothetical protein